MQDAIDELRHIIRPTTRQLVRLILQFSAEKKRRELRDFYSISDENWFEELVVLQKAKALKQFRKENPGRIFYITSTTLNLLLSDYWLKHIRRIKICKMHDGEIIMQAFFDSHLLLLTITLNAPQITVLFDHLNIIENSHMLVDYLNTDHMFGWLYVSDLNIIERYADLSRLQLQITHVDSPLYNARSPYFLQVLRIYERFVGTTNTLGVVYDSGKLFVKNIAEARQEFPHIEIRYIFHNATATTRDGLHQIWRYKFDEKSELCRRTIITGTLTIVRRRWFATRSTAIRRLAEILDWREIDRSLTITWGVSTIDLPLPNLAHAIIALLNKQPSFYGLELWYHFI